MSRFCILVLALALVGEIATAGELSPESAAEVAAMDSEVDRLVERGDKAAAQQLARKSLEIRERAYGSEHPALIPSLDNMGWSHEAFGDFENARLWRGRALEVRRAVFGADHPKVADGLLRLARIDMKAGQPLDAVERIEEALRLVVAAGVEPIEVAWVEHELAAALRESGRPEEAVEIQLRVADVVEGELGPDNPELVPVLNNLAQDARWQGDVLRAMSLLERAVRLAEVKAGPESVEAASALVQLATLVIQYRDWDRADALLLRSYEILERRTSPTHPDLLSVLTRRAVVMRKRGHTAAAVGVLRDVLDRTIAVYGELNPRTALAREQLGHALFAGNIGAASAEFDAAVDVLNRTLGSTHPVTLRVVANQASTLSTVGMFDDARAVIERVLAEYQKARPDTLAYAGTLSQLATILYQCGDRHRAHAIFNEAGDIFAAALGPDHPDTLKVRWNAVQALGHLAEPDALVRASRERVRAAEEQLGAESPLVARHLIGLTDDLINAGDLPAAVETAERALAIHMARHPDGDATASVLDRLGWLHVSMGDPDRGIPLVEQALRIMEKSSLPDADGITSIRFRLGVARAAAGHEGGESEMDDALATGREATRDAMASASEREAFALAWRDRSMMDAWLGHRGHADEAGAAWDAVLAWKGLVTDALEARRERLLATDDPRVSELFGELEELRRQIHSEMNRPDLAHGLATRRELMDDLLVERDRLERQLARISRDFSARLERRSVLGADVCAALPDDAVAVDYLRYTHPESDRYLAFVVGRDCDVVRVELGGAAHIEKAVAAYRSLLKDSTVLTSRLDDRGKSVRELIWDPVEEHVGAAELIIVVPDGAIAGVSFASLPLSDGYFVERYATAYLDHAGDLLHRPPATGQGAVLVGGVDFGPVDNARDDGLLAMGGADCVEAYPPIPGTGDEIEQIAKHWRKVRRREAVTRLRGLDADEGTVVDAMAGRRVIHLASHGYFGNSGCAGQTFVQNAWREGIGADPLMSAGIALAGVNQAAAAGTGLLTADEVAGIDLRGTELVVLSACDTGVGEAVSGEGVLGLRRAFVTAGAQNLVMSLWSVPDDATATLMTGFYENWLTRRGTVTAAVALRGAQLDLLRESRSRLGDSRPADWAAFIAAGPGL